jgi:DNA repair photolyase
VELKVNAPELLEAALRKKRKRCMIGTGSMSDPYMNIPESLDLTRRCLELIERYGFGLALLTKSALVLRDLDLLKAINRKAKCVVQMTLTTYDEELCKIVEPNVSTTLERFAVLQELNRNGIETVVWFSPLLPYINDTEANLRGILKYCEAAGVRGIICFGIGMTLREGDREYYYTKLDEHFPGLKVRYIKTYGNNYVINSPHNDRLMRIFDTECRRMGVLHTPNEVFAYLNEFVDKTVPAQMELF